MSVTEPRKILTPWATSGLKNSIPQAANPVTGNAGYDQGFPAINMTPKEAGGIPPYGQDFNGILNDITKILQFVQAGGTPSYSSDLSQSTGGYGKGATIIGSDGLTLWQNTIDGNTSDPDALGTGWVNLLLKILPKRVFGQNDFIRIPDVPGGLIIQWGIFTSSASGNVVTLPVAYPTAQLRSYASPGMGSYTIGVGGVTQSNQILWVYDSATKAPAGGVNTQFWSIGF